MTLKLILTIVLTVLLASCTGAQTKIILGNVEYQIPTHYIVSSTSNVGARGLDNSSNMLALTFAQDEELIHLTSKNGWLPSSPISAMIFDESVGEFENSFSTEISNEKFEFVEFGNLYRVFDSNLNSKWKSLPKRGIVISPTKTSAERVLDCTAMGGIKGINASRTQKEIPTSCKVIVKRDNLIIRFSSTEENLVENFQLIHDLIISRLNSWKAD